MDALTRREFNRWMFLLTGSGILPSLSWAGVRPGEVAKNLLILRFQGGMDVSLGLDPQTHSDGTTQNDLFLEYEPDAILEVGNIRLGPAAHALRSVASELCVINGIDMRIDLGHENLNRVIDNGRWEHSGSFVLRMGGVQGLDNDAILRNSEHSEPATRLVGVTVTERRQALQGVESVAAGALADSSYVVLDELSPATRSRLQVLDPRLQEVLPREAPENFRSFDHDVAVALASFASGHSRFAHLTVNGFDPAMDTHTSHRENHLRLQTAIWNKVAALVNFMKSVEITSGRSLLEDTVVLVTNEFSRTPYLNSDRRDAGKDHNPHTNSFALFGGGVPAGATIGASMVVRRTQQEIRSRIGESHVARWFDFQRTEPVAVSDIRSRMQALRGVSPGSAGYAQQSREAFLGARNLGLITVNDVFSTLAQHLGVGASQVSLGRRIWRLS